MFMSLVLILFIIVKLNRILLPIFLKYITLSFAKPYV